MPQIKDDIDLFFNSAGDFALDNTGDIASTESDLLLSFKQEIYNRVKSDLQDWSMYSWIGAGLSEIIGEPNTRETAEIGKEKIKTALTIGAFLSAEDVNIKYVPVAKDALMYILEINVDATPENGYTSEVQVTLLLDIDNHKLTVY